MNKFLSIVVVLLFSIFAFAQKTKTAAKPTAAAPTPAEAPAPSTTKVAQTSSSALSPSRGNPWEFGINGGLYMILGDVNSRLKGDLNNSTFGFHFRKALSHSFSWRWQYNYGNATMLDPRPHYTAVSNGLSTTNPLWFVSSQSYSHALFWDNIYTVGNNLVKKPSTKVIINLFAGPSLFMYKTKVNFTDSRNGFQTYSNQFSTIANQYTAAVQNDVLTGDNNAKDITRRALDATFDDSYETLANNNGGKTKVGNFVLVPALSFGASVAFKVAKFMNLELEQRMLYIFDDYVDGERWANYSTTPVYSQNNDWASYTTIKMNFNLARKGKEPLYWQNGNAEIMSKLASMNPKKDINAAFMDDDGDGVPNILDQELDSREGCPVDTKGIMLDSDKDGYLDCDDKEPYSPPGYPVDDKGVAKVPPPACCTDLQKEVKADEAKVEKVLCNETTLPSVQFDKDKYGITSAMVPSLKVIGDKMQGCPDMKVVVNGINDRNSKNGKVNEQLSYNRAMEVTNYLAEKYGISRDRFIVRYNLEGTGDSEADRSVVLRPAQMDETGNSNPPSPHPGLKAGSR